MHPVLFNIGNFPVRSFGVMILIAFLAGLWLVRWRAPRYGLDVTKATDLAFTVLIAGILGARLAYIVQNVSYFSQHPNELFSLRFEGLTSYGGVILGAAAVAWWAVRNKASLGKLTDLYAPAFMFGHVFGRIGCFLNGCCYGGSCPSHVFLATQFPGTDGPHYPAQLYDSGMNLIGVLVLLAIERKGWLRTGQLTGLFLVIHNGIRFVYEFWRAGTDEQNAQGNATAHYFGGLPITEAQAMSLALMVAGLIVFFANSRKSPALVSGEAQPA
jgi:phosphatidylglycerol:prolipoprotein diacylglycerol transferase